MKKAISRFCGRLPFSGQKSIYKRRIGSTPCVFLFLTVFVLFGTTLFARDGDLDRSFGDAGKLIIQIAPDIRDFIRAIAIQSDGKIILGGELGDFTADGNSSVLVRLNIDGTLDQSFGTGGKVINQGQIHLSSLLIQPDGKILTSGATSVIEISHDFVVTRYNSNGSLDQSFANGGYAVNGVGNANDVVLQPDGKILLVGTLPVFRNGSDFLVARFNANGTADQSFGNGGRITTSFTSGLNSGDSALDGALQSDGKLVVLGQISGTPAVLIRYNTDGSVDTTFGLEGSVISSNFAASARRLLIQPDGKIVVGGGAFVVARYNSDGHLDQSFGTSGRSSGGFGTGNGSLEAIASQVDGKILIAGWVSWSMTGNSAFAVGRYHTNGTLDSTFGNGGFVLTEFTGALDLANAITVQADGKAVAAGYAAEPGGSYHDFAVARYMSTSLKTTSLPRVRFDFDGDGKSDIGITRPNSGITEWWISRSSDSSVFATVFGVPSDIPTPGDFTGDGKTDIALFRPSTGQWFVLRSDDFSYAAFPFGTNGDIPMPADYDGDRKTDPAVFRPSQGTWFISRTSDNQTTIAQFGVAGDKPVSADYDGDGKADMAVYRLNNGAQEWWIQRSTAGLFATVFGVLGDKAVPGDYTGDGKVDIAVWRPSNGNWFILRSEDLSFLAFPWGSNGDLPAPGDYDGDGKTDAAVFRSSQFGTWFINRTGGQGPLITNFGASTDSPVAGAYVR